jgi:hypothetical protein
MPAGRSAMNRPPGLRRALIMSAIVGAAGGSVKQNSLFLLASPARAGYHLRKYRGVPIRMLAP